MLYTTPMGSNKTPQQSADLLAGSSPPTPLRSVPIFWSRLLVLAIGEVIIFMIAKAKSLHDAPHFFDAEMVMNLSILPIILVSFLIFKFRLMRSGGGLTRYSKLLAVVVVLPFIVGCVFWQSVEYPTLIHRWLASQGVTATAQIVEIHLFRSGIKGSEREVRDLSESDRIVMTLTYGHGYSATIALTRHKANSYAELYRQAFETRHIFVRYLPTFHEIVRPDVEFVDPGNNPYAEGRS